MIDDENIDDQDLTRNEAADAAEGDEEAGDEAIVAGNGYKPHNDDDASDDKIHHLGGMYQNWFLDYASYVILERAVPHLADGLKPVQRRILHAMKVIDDGRYNKVANIVGQTMQYHPHGDASIGDALVQLGQKDLLIDCQGNWGNILTGDSAAAPRYIEARLSKFALEVVFNNKITPWQLSYDGRKKEPINLPIKFPLLLAQGVEGIAVGLSSKILPHNFNELLDASIACLKGEPFELYPDFPTGGLIDVSKYHDGARGGVIKVRSRIEKIDQKSLRIIDVPFGRTTDSLIESIRKTIENGKIKIRNFDDFTSDHAEIVVHLMPGVSSDKTIDALYAFTDCEISISPNCCVIYDKKPHFLTVSEVLRRSAENTKELLRQELEVSKGELLEHLMTCSLEKIFIEERIYKGQEYEQAKDLDTALAYIDMRLEPFKPDFVREVTRDDLLRLEDIKMARIHKFSSQKAEEDILQTKKKIREVEKNLRHLTTYTIKWFEHLKEKYGADHPRMTEIRNFDSVDATKVIESNMKLWFNKAEGFMGTGLKQSESEFVCNCSEIDEILVIYKNGQYKVVKVDQKVYLGKDVLYINVYRKNDNRTIYNVVYRDGKGGPHMIKRFAITSVMRDKVYDITQGKEGSRIAYFSANQNGEAEVIKVYIKSKLRNSKVVHFERDFAETPIKGRGVKGNLLTKADVQKILLVSKGGSTLGGRPVWWDPDVQRINYNKQGQYLGEFLSEDRVLVILDNWDYYITTFEETVHFESNVLRVEKYDPQKVWTFILWDKEMKCYSLKRSLLDARPSKQNMLGDPKRFKIAVGLHYVPQTEVPIPEEGEEVELPVDETQPAEAPEPQPLVIDTPYPRFRITMGKPDDFRPALEVDADEFIPIRSINTKGKRLTPYKVASIEEIQPLRWPETEDTAGNDEGGEEPEEEAPSETLF